MYGNYITIATEEEVKVYKAIEAKLDELGEEEIERITETVGDWVFSWGSERKTNYNKVYRLAKKLKVTTYELETWYCID